MRPPTGLVLLAKHIPTASAVGYGLSSLAGLECGGLLLFLELTTGT